MEDDVATELAPDVAGTGDLLATPRRRRFLAGQIEGLPRAFWWLWLGTLVNRAGTFVQPFLVLYLTGPRHVSAQTAGAILTVWGCGFVLSQPVGGYLTDRFGRRHTLAGSLIASSIMLFTLSFARSLVLIAMLVFVLATLADMYRPASTAAIADLVAERDRMRAFALQFWAINLGYSVSSSAAGLLLHFGFGPLFVLDAATTFAFGALALRFVPETRPDTEHASVRLTDPIRLLRHDRLLAVATVLLLVYGSLYVQAVVGLPLAIRHAGLSASTYGYVAAVNGVLIVVLQPLTLHWLAARGRRVTLPAGIALVGVGMAATGLCHTAWQFVATVSVWTIGEIGTAGSFQALIASLAPEDMRGRYAGALGLAWGAAGLFGPVGGATVFAASPATLWFSCLALGLVAAAGQYWLLGAIDRAGR